MVGPIDKKTAKQWIKAAGRLSKESGGDAAAEAPAASGNKPKLQIGGLTHDPTGFKVGEGVKSTVTVTNNGSEGTTVKLQLYLNEGLADATTVTVKPGKAKEASFRWTAQEKNKLNIRGELVP